MPQTDLNEVFDGVIKVIGTRLKTLGFTQRGKAFTIATGANCGIIDFQRSVKSSKNALLFTITLGVVCGDLLDSGSSAARKAQILDAHVRQRIGMLLPDCPDKWWEITRATDTNSLVEELWQLLVTKAGPQLHIYLDTRALIALWESGQSPGLTDVQRTRFLTRLKAIHSGRREGSTA